MELADVSKILRININKYFDGCVNLMSLYNQSFIDYYTNGTVVPVEGLELLDKLTDQYYEIRKKLASCRPSLNNLYYFEVFDKIDDVYSSLLTFQNYSRWLRSSFVNGRFKESTEVQIVMRQNQTLENASLEMGFSDSEEGFVDVAMRNHLKETDYDLKGGLEFTFGYQNDQRISLQTVIDVTTGKNLLGKDVCAKIQFSDDDLLSLTPDDTFKQTCAILTNLTKNSNPEFPHTGFSKETISNKNLLNNMLPVFVRQLYSTVAEDDTIASFKILKLEMQGDALVIEIEFKSHLSDEVTQTVYGN